MKTFNLKEAAEFLKMHPETVRYRTKAGDLPGAKPGKNWVFLEEDLVEWIRNQYVTQERQIEKIVPFGGTGSRRRTAKEYADLLKPTTKGKRKK